MIALILLLSLAAVLPQSSGNHDFAAESTSRTEKQKEIVDRHNYLRRTVSPTTSNMLQRFSANPCKCIDMYSNCNDLVRENKCQDDRIKKACPASCFCLTEIE